MRAPFFQPVLARGLKEHGMLGVLALLCLYYSAVTCTEQSPTGAAAAERVAHRIASAKPGASVLVAGRDTEEDRQFVAAMEGALKKRRLNLAGKVAGEPRAAREALEALAAAGKRLDAIAATPACADWPIWERARERYPALGRPEIMVAQSYRWPTFLTRQNLLNVANQITVVAILAVGMTVVIITGGIDLSVGSLIALSAVAVTKLIRDFGGGTGAGAGALVLCSLASIACCAGVGFLSGVVIACFGVPAFIATLAVMQVASGLAFIFAKGGSIYELPDSFTWLGRGVGWLGLPHAVVLMAALYLAAHFLMARTTLGRRLYAIGGNAEAARLSGVNVTAVLLFAYTFSAMLAGLGGVLLASQLKSGAPTYGLMYELYVIAAVVVGGTSLSGGEGRIFGTLTGVLIIAVIQNGMNLTGVESYLQKVVLGAVILGAVLLDLIKKRDWRARRAGARQD